MLNQELMLCRPEVFQVFVRWLSFFHDYPVDTSLIPPVNG